MGVPVEQLLAQPGAASNMERSVEFCGGTHVNDTAAIAHFALVSEEAVAKGVRRIIGLTGHAAATAIEAADALDRRAADVAKAPDADLARLVQALTTEVDGATIPVARKAALRATLAALGERVKAAS